MTTTVNFEIAKLLKEKGFEQESDTYYTTNGELKYDFDYPALQPSKPYGYYDAPTIAEIVMWLYENHKFWIVAFPIEDGFWAFDVFDSKSECIKSGMEFNSPTEAYETAIEYTLENLI